MIKIIAGVYGHKENGVIMPKDSNSAPFSLDPEREAELVAGGIAEYANVVIPDEGSQETGDGQQNDDSQGDGDGQQNDDSQGDGDGQQNDDSQGDGDGQQNDDSQGDGDNQEDEDTEKKQKPKYSEEMKLPELKEIAATFGLDAQNMRTKAGVIKLLDDYFEDDGEQPPTFGALDPVE